MQLSQEFLPQIMKQFTGGVLPVAVCMKCVFPSCPSFLSRFPYSSLTLETAQQHRTLRRTKLLRLPQLRPMGRWHPLSLARRSNRRSKLGSVGPRRASFGRRDHLWRDGLERPERERGQADEADWFDEFAGGGYDRSQKRRLACCRARAPRPRRCPRDYSRALEDYFIWSESGRKLDGLVSLVGLIPLPFLSRSRVGSYTHLSFATPCTTSYPSCIPFPAAHVSR